MSRSSTKTRVTVLKTVEVPQLQFIVGLGMHQIETVQKTVEFRSCRLVLGSSSSGQGCRRALWQFVDNLVDVPVVQVFFLDMVEMPVVVQRQVLGL